ncbi:MAG: sialidase family protein, partial [Planctomycetota bacterium]
DREETWPISRHIPHGLGAVYSSITADKDGMIYLLFEVSSRAGRVDDVTFAKFNLAWLKEGDPPGWTDGLSGVKRK